MVQNCKFIQPKPKRFEGNIKYSLEKYKTHMFRIIKNDSDMNILFSDLYTQK